MELPQVISGSGARYANADESFVFWNKGDTAFITEGPDDNDNMTYKDCVAIK
jgi:membrane-bound inhibitor of C-type lysozyme